MHFKSYHENLKFWLVNVILDFKTLILIKIFLNIDVPFRPLYYITSVEILKKSTFLFKEIFLAKKNWKNNIQKEITSKYLIENITEQKYKHINR